MSNADQNYWLYENLSDMISHCERFRLYQTREMLLVTLNALCQEETRIASEKHGEVISIRSRSSSISGSYLTESKVDK